MPPPTSTMVPSSGHATRGRPAASSVDVRSRMVASNCAELVRVAGQPVEQGEAVVHERERRPAGRERVFDLGPGVQLERLQVREPRQAAGPSGHEPQTELRQADVAVARVGDDASRGRDSQAAPQGGGVHAGLAESHGMAAGGRARYRPPTRFRGDDQARRERTSPSRERRLYARAWASSARSARCRAIACSDVVWVIIDEMSSITPAPTNGSQA